MRINQLAGLRGVCAWWVVLFHSLTLLGGSIPAPIARILAHGYLAVDLFFLLSGFVLFLSYHAALAKPTSGSIGKFYWHRLARIYPVHFVMLLGYLGLYALFLLLSSSGSAPESYTWTSFFQSLFLVHMWFGSELTWNVPSWSISSEWFVYLFFPLMALGLRKVRANAAVHVFMIVAIAGILALVYSLHGVSSLGADVPRMALIRTMFEFLMGVFVGSLFVNHRALLEKYGNGALIGFLGLSVLYGMADLPDYTLIPMSFALLIAYLSSASSWITRALSRPSLVYLGEISYSTYMVHYLVYDLLKAVFLSSTDGIHPLHVWLSFVVVFILSMVLHHGVDAPSQRYIRSLASRKNVPSQYPSQG